MLGASLLYTIVLREQWLWRLPVKVSAGVFSFMGVSGGTRKVLLSAESSSSTGEGPTEGGSDPSVSCGDTSQFPSDGGLLCTA